MMNNERKNEKEDGQVHNAKPMLTAPSSKSMGSA